MKIISKYKDYYDYISGVYGEDPLLILDRRESDPTSISNGKVSLYITGFLIEGYHLDGKTYYGKDILQFGEYSRNTRYNNNINTNYIIIPTFSNGRRIYGDKQNTFNVDIIKDDLDINNIQNCPILIKSQGISRSYDKFPKLDELNLGGFVDPTTIYNWLSQWLSQKLDEQLEKTNNLSDEEKILNKGFDKKISFRHR